jgi:hypothetical protein
MCAFTKQLHTKKEANVALKHIDYTQRHLHRSGVCKRGIGNEDQLIFDLPGLLPPQRRQTHQQAAADLADIGQGGCGFVRSEEVNCYLLCRIMLWFAVL